MRYIVMAAVLSAVMVLAGCSDLLGPSKTVRCTQQTWYADGTEKDVVYYATVCGRE